MTTDPANILQLNVGFLLNEEIGYSREIAFNANWLQADDARLRNLHGRMRFTRTQLGLFVDGDFTAEHDTTCARCLEPTSTILDVHVSELYVFPFEPGAEFYIPETRLLDLEPLVLQELMLSESIQVLCRPDCRGLCPECGQNWNDGPCACETDDIDPRLTVLRKLLNSD